MIDPRDRVAELEVKEKVITAVGEAIEAHGVELVFDVLVQGVVVIAQEYGQEPEWLFEKVGSAWFGSVE